MKNKKNANSRKDRGFTLVEIMVVVVIIGMLATLIVPSVIGNTDRARRKTAISNLAAIDGAAKMYWTNTGRIPSIEDLLEPDENGHPWLEGYSEAPKDPWNNEYYILETENRHFAVFSNGPDGIENTEDDLRSDRKDQQ